MYETAVVGQTEVGIDIFRITFDNGDWWDLLSVRTWGTASAVRRATLGFDTSVDDEAMRMRESTNLAALNGSTVRWSWSVPVTADFINSLPEDVVNATTRELADRHLDRILGMDDDKKKASRWQWLWAIRSRITGWMSMLTSRL